MSLEIVIVGVVAVAAFGLAANGLVSWKQQGILENEIKHLSADMAEVKADVKWLITHLKKND